MSDTAHSGSLGAIFIADSHFCGETLLEQTGSLNFVDIGFSDSLPLIRGTGFKQKLKLPVLTKDQAQYEIIIGLIEQMVQIPALEPSIADHVSSHIKRNRPSQTLS